MEVPKLVSLAIVFLVLVGGLQIVFAQAPMSSYDYYIMRTQTVNAAANRAKENKANKLAAEKVETLGAEKIKTGKANLTFTRTEAALERLVKSMTFYPDEPQTFPGQVNLIKNYVERFNQILSKAGGHLDNCADAYAVAYSMSYLVYNDRSPDMSEVKKIRDQYIVEKMSDAYFQGLPDADKQRFYDTWALSSVQAMDQREKASQAVSQSEKQSAITLAKQYASYTLENK